MAAEDVGPICDSEAVFDGDVRVAGARAAGVAAVQTALDEAVEMAGEEPSRR